MMQFLELTMPTGITIYISPYNIVSFHQPASDWDDPPAEAGCIIDFCNDSSQYVRESPEDVLRLVNDVQLAERREWQQVWQESKSSVTDGGTF